jgi:hypothetical protein
MALFSSLAFLIELGKFGNSVSLPSFHAPIILEYTLICLLSCRSCKHVRLGLLSNLWLSRSMCHHSCTLWRLLTFSIELVSAYVQLLGIIFMYQTSQPPSAWSSAYHLLRCPSQRYAELTDLSEYWLCLCWCSCPLYSQ